MDLLSTRPKVKSHYPSWSGCYGPAFDQTQSQKSLSLILVWLLWTRFRPDPKSKVIILLGLVAMDPLSTRPKVKSHYPSWSGCYGPAFDQTQSQKSLSFLVWLLWTRFRPDPKSKVIILLGLVAMDPLSTRPKVKSHYPSWSGCYGPAFDQTQSQKSLSFLVWLLWTRFRPDPKSKVIILLGLVAMDPLSTRPKVKSHYPSWSGCYGPAFDQTQSQKSLSFVVWLLWTRFRPDPKSKVIILLGLVAMDPLSTRPKVKSHYPSWSGCYGPAFDQTQSQKSLSSLAWLLWTRFRPNPMAMNKFKSNLIQPGMIRFQNSLILGCYGVHSNQT